MDNNINHNGVYFAPPEKDNEKSKEKVDLSLYAPVKKEHKPFEKKDTVFVFLTLIAAFLMVDFAAFHGFNIGFSIAYYALFGVTTAYLWKKGAAKNVFSLLCGGLSLAGAATFALFDNMLINALMFFLVAGLYCFYVIGISDTFKRPRGSFKALFDVFESVVGDTFGGLERVFGSAKATSRKNKKVINALIGIGIAIPFLIVIIPLLVQSDAAFEGLIKRIAADIGIYLVEFALALAITPFLFSYFFSKRSAKRAAAAPKDNTRVLSPTISVSFLSVISLTYLVYLFSQLAYFFSAFKGILPADYHYTASAFARRGFYEMFVICVINILLVSAVGIMTKRIHGRVAPSIKVLSAFVTLFSVLLIVIAMQKMRLNISIYGLSVNRVLVTTLMVMLLVTIAFFLLHIFAPKVPYLQPVILICSAMFVALSFANIDARCADYNIKAYQSGKLEMVDTVAIRKFSDSAVPYLIDLAGSDDKVAANSARNQIALYICENENLELKRNTKDMRIEYDIKDFRRYNRARNTAYEMVKQYYGAASKAEYDQMNRLVVLYRDGYYDEEENYFIEFTDEEYSIKHSYNSKTGLYDKTEKTKEW